MSEDRRLDCHCHSPHGAGYDDRRSYPNILPEYPFADAQQVAHLQSDLPVDAERVDAGNAHFYDPRGKRRDGRAAGAEPGRSEVSEDQHIIQKNIHSERNDRHGKADLHGFHASQGREQDAVYREEHVGEADDLHILRSFADHRLFKGEQGKHFPGHEKHRRPHSRCDHNAEQHTDCRRFFDR